MKRTYIITIILLVGYSLYAQDTTYLKVSKNESGIIVLEAKAKYDSLPAKDKPAIIRISLPTNYSNEIIVIDYGYKREMWRKDIAKN